MNPDLADKLAQAFGLGSADEVETLVDLLQRTTAKIPHVNEFDPGSTAAATTKPRHRKNTMMR